MGATRGLVMVESDVSGALRDALAARGEIAERPDRCRAMLGDLLGSDLANHRRELALLVAAVEERIPDALRGATTPGDVESIAMRFREDRALEPSAARWTVEVWSDALRSVGVTSIPTSVTTEPSSESVIDGDADRAGEDVAATAISAGVLPGDVAVPAVQAAPTEHELATLRESVADHERLQVADRLTSISDVSEVGPPSPRSRRALLIGAVASVVAIALAVGALLAFGGENNPPPEGKPSDGPSNAAVVQLAFPTDAAGARTTVRRTWSLDGDDGSVLKGKLDFKMSKGADGSYDEVFPKSLAKTTNAVHLDPAYNRDFEVKWVKPDPVLRIVPKARVGSVQLRYEITVPPEGKDQKRLAKWQQDAKRERAAWIKEKHRPAALKITSPKNDDHFKVATAQFHGTTKPGNKVRLLGTSTTPDGALQGPARNLKVAKNGTWSVDVLLVEGPNFFRFEATSPIRQPHPILTVVYYDATPAPPGPGGTGGPVSPPPSPQDRDGDGTLDGSDRCPDLAGPTDNQGCPVNPPPNDADHDGTPDPNDKCPTESGPAANNGCPWPPPTATGGSFTVSIDANGWQGDPYYGWRLPVGQGDSAPGGHQLALAGASGASYGIASALDYRCGSGNDLCAFYHTCFNGNYDVTFSYTIKDVTTRLTDTATITVHVKINSSGPPTYC
jgi:hypothetical protein